MKFIGLVLKEVICFIFVPFSLVFDLRENITVFDLVYTLNNFYYYELLVEDEYP